jgi:hypothetical protein
MENVFLLSNIEADVVNKLSRREVLGIASTITTSGCLGVGSDPSGSPEDAAEKSGVELIVPPPDDIVVYMESYVTISAVVYNSTSDQTEVTVSFTLYGGQGGSIEATDSVVVGSFKEAPISYTWQLPVDIELPAVNFDIETASVE